MNFSLPLILLSLMTGADNQPSQAVESQKSAESSLKPHPKVHKNHLRRASAQYLAAYRRITWHYDFETAAELARETGRPMFVIFCRAGTIDDALTGEPRCAS
jgi:hypothetical protein